MFDQYSGYYELILDSFSGELVRYQFDANGEKLEGEKLATGIQSMPTEIHYIADLRGMSILEKNEEQTIYETRETYINFMNDFGSDLYFEMMAARDTYATTLFYVDNAVVTL